MVAKDMRLLILIGTVLIVAGLLISIWGTLLLDNSSQQIRVTLRNIGNGLYASENISMTGTDGLLYISNSSSTVHLIQSNYLSEINQNNIANYSIKPVNTSTVTVGGYDFTASSGEFFENLSGNYTIVEQGNYITLFYAIPGRMQLLAKQLYGPMLISGTALWIAGLVVVTYGALRKSKR